MVFYPRDPDIQTLLVEQVHRVAQVLHLKRRAFMRRKPDFFERYGLAAEVAQPPDAPAGRTGLWPQVRHTTLWFL